MKRLFILLTTLIATVTATAQQIPQDRLLDGFARMYANSLQEKVYVMTDKPYYSAGERIWLRGWVVDAVSHTGQTPTNYLYVDLIDAGDNLVQRIKIKRDSTGFSNAIDLPSDIKAGSYSLVAFTCWAKIAQRRLWCVSMVSMVRMQATACSAPRSARISAIAILRYVPIAMGR